ncbi:MAG: hypothetical protein Q7S32_04520 [bacterium]|nr:hypothetical protein [bacterium]
MAEFKTLLKRAEKVKFKYEELNRRKGQVSWRAPEYAQGLVGDAADLIKFVLAYKKSKKKKEMDKKIRHELADCLWSMMAVALELDIDLEKEFLLNLEYLEQKLTEEE